MSTFQVLITRLDSVDVHPNADALEMCVVGGYRAVVPKGTYKTGDVVVYIPEAAIVPDDLLEEIGLTGKLAGPQKNRVKAIRLRGELSQGIVCTPKAVSLRDDLVGHDVAEMLGIAKWVPEIPVHMSGAVEPAPDQSRWCDIENVKGFMDEFVSDDLVVATEKVHGTCCCVTLDVRSGTVSVSSKGFNAKGLGLVQDEKNLYWRAVLGYEIPNKLQKLAEQFQVGSSIALFGEIYGKGIQDLQYGVERTSIPSFIAFDMKFDDVWVDASVFGGLVDSVHIPRVPVLYSGYYDYDKLVELASGLETISGKGVHIREGIVVRSTGDTSRHGNRKILKFVSPDYLMRGNATEYE